MVIAQNLHVGSQVWTECGWQKIIEVFWYHESRFVLYRVEANGPFVRCEFGESVVTGGI